MEQSNFDAGLALCLGIGSLIAIGYLLLVIYGS